MMMMMMMLLLMMMMLLLLFTSLLVVLLAQARPAGHPLLVFIADCSIPVTFGLLCCPLLRL